MPKCSAATPAMGPSGLCGANATPTVSAMAAILGVSHRPPAWQMSGWAMSSARALSAAWNAARLCSRSPAAIGIPRHDTGVTPTDAVALGGMPPMLRRDRSHEWDGGGCDRGAIGRTVRSPLVRTTATRRLPIGIVARSVPAPGPTTLPLALQGESQGGIGDWRSDSEVATAVGPFEAIRAGGGIGAFTISWHRTDALERPALLPDAEDLAQPWARLAGKLTRAAQGAGRGGICSAWRFGKNGPC